ncbi:hypothetical protein PVK06_026800 [Gossypium arboreum]|uniref:Uncharacterized protein n=1 Tax=Gossypium arboreum TaxID=29729 RepID=A0ABR0NZX0_GOSAR|nr:hypothetical protein PVK06_026800 [Gossypium arboreum]
MDIAPECICEHYDIPFYQSDDIENMMHSWESQRKDPIQWKMRFDDEDTKDEANEEGNGVEEGDDDEAMEDDDVAPYHDDFEDLFASEQPST